MLPHWGAGKELRIEVLCSEGCNVCFHYPACWHAFERLHKADHPTFSFKACRTFFSPTPQPSPRTNSCGTKAQWAAKRESDP